MELIGWGLYLPHVAIWAVMFSLSEPGSYFDAGSARLVTVLIAVPLLSVSMWFWVAGIFRIPRLSIVQGAPLAIIIGLTMYISLLTWAIVSAVAVPYAILTGM